MLKSTILTAASLLVAASACAQGSLFILPTPVPGETSYISDISRNGEVALCSGGTTYFLWNVGESLIPLTALPAYPKMAFESISPDGTTAIGSAFDNAMFNPERIAVKWTEAEGMVQLDYAPGTANTASARAASHDASIIFGSSGGKATRWTAPDQPELLPGLGSFNSSYVTACSSDGTVAAGNAAPGPSGYGHFFIWNEATGTTVYGPFTQYQLVVATGISDDGSVIVGNAISVESTYRTRAFRWTADTGFVFYSDFPVSSEIIGLSDDAETMIGSTPLTGNAAAVLNMDGTGTLINDYADENDVDRDGWTLLNMEALSGDGRTIIGLAQKGSDFNVYALTIACTADYNNNGTTDILDFLDYISDFNDCSGLPTPCGTFGNPDLTGDGFVDVLDLLIFLDAHAAGC